MAAAGPQISHRKIQKVPLVLLEEEKNKNDYSPKVVSIGPYHHGKANLAFVEALKPIAVELFTSGSKEFYYNNILDIIDYIRNCYDESVVSSDSELAEMMLHDACLIILFMGALDPSKLFKQLGMLTVTICPRDFFLLENQIPLRVINLLITLKYGAGEDVKLLHTYMSITIFGEDRQRRISSSGQQVNKGSDEPLHLVEALHQLVVSDCVERTRSLCFGCRWLCCFNGNAAGHGRTTTESCCSCTLLCCSGGEKQTGFFSEPEAGVVPVNQGVILRLVKFLTCNKAGKNRKGNMKYLIHSFRTVTDLKAKGIYFRPSPTDSLKDVSFKKRLFYARLELPEWGVSIYTKVFFLNLVAYELSPNNPTKWEVASYINLMKSLIDSPEDVKELRERKIFYNMLGSDEEVLNVYKDINTYGADNFELFHPVKEKIQAHYNSRTKTWMAELMHNNFRTPWTTTAFLAAVTLLAISAGQLYYAVYPN